MLRQRNNFLWFKVNGLLRQFIVRGGCSSFTKHYTVNEYPKSGGSWLGQMLSEALEVPFPRNRLPMLRSSIMHGHYLNPKNMKNVCVLWRDCRDILISQYYHSLFYNDKGNARLVDITRRHFQVDDYHDIQANLPKFICFVYESKISPRFNWSQFVEQWHNRNCVHVKYEDLRQATAKELQRIVKELSNKTLCEESAMEIADKFSFENQAGRKPGQENAQSFMRKGVVGDWKNHFTQEARELFCHYAGDALIKLGYEKDYSWVNG